MERAFKASSPDAVTSIKRGAPSRDDWGVWLDGIPGERPRTFDDLAKGLKEASELADKHGSWGWEDFTIIAVQV